MIFRTKTKQNNLLNDYGARLFHLLILFKEDASLSNY